MSDPPSSASVIHKIQHTITPSSSSSSPPASNIDPLLIQQQQRPLLPSAPGDPSQPAAVVGNHPKRPRYGVMSSSESEWKQLLPGQKLLLPPPPPKQQQLQSSSPSSSTNPEMQILENQPHRAASSSDTAACSSRGCGDNRLTTTKMRQDQEESHGQGQLLRKGKHVSPVWKPYEMVMLAKGWHMLFKSSGSGRGNKSRAEKDRDVAEFLNRHGVERDAKAAGTKWDNMLGDFRKVYQWERGGGRIEAGVSKSYFRLSPYERKNQHGLPTCFDEEVFEEMTQFMGLRIKINTPLATSNLLLHHDDVSLSKKQVAATRSSVDGGREHAVIGSYNKLQEETVMRRSGKMKMVWEEYVSLWSEQGAEMGGRGRVKNITSFLNADELVFFDDSMVATSLEVFENGPLTGFSVDMFAPGQQVKVFGRRKAASLPASASYCHTCRVQLPATQLSSIRSSSECHDPSEYYLARLKIPPPALPTLSDLSSHLQQPPSQELKFPLRRDVYMDLPHGKELFFSTSNDPLDCRMITYNILGQVLRSNLGACSTPSSRDSYIALWDDCINSIVRQFCPLEMVLVRKPAASLALTKSKEISWPNLTGFIRGLCLWRGEETDMQQVTEPSESLVQKLLWSYADLPYIFGYYAVGCTVTLSALSRSRQDNQVMRTDLISLDLSSQAGRLKALIPCWRVATLLPVLADKCFSSMGLERHIFSDFERIALGNGEVIERNPKTQIRYFTNKTRWACVKEIYDFLDRRIPCSEYMGESCEVQLCHTFKPRGCNVKPRNVEQLIEALKSVSKSLVALHDLSFMHRDISWDTVLRRVDNNNNNESDVEEVEWFLSRFDAAAGAPQLSAFGGGLAHAPEMKRGLHGVKVDVWGIGWLIKTSGLEAMLPMQLRDLEGRCLEHNQEIRPTVADCYHHLLQLSAAAAADY